MVRVNSDFYQRLRMRMRRWGESEKGRSHPWAEYLLLAPDLFHLLCKLSADRRVPTRHKAKLGLAVAYFISPLDLVPEALLGPAGYVDDVALAAAVLNNLLGSVDPAILREHWAGEEDVFTVIRDILAVADRMVGSGLWKRIRRWF